MKPDLVPFCTHVGRDTWVIEAPAWAMIVMGSTVADCGEPRQKARYVVVSQPTANIRLTNPPVPTIFRVQRTCPTKVTVPKMASFMEISRFTDDEAREYLEGVRWPNGPVCPHCGDTEKAKKMNGSAHRAGLFKCYSCRKQFSVTVGTVMHRSKIPLRTWVMAFHIICASKKSISAKQLERMLELGSYQTAWHLCHRIRLAMREEPLAGKLSGIVEADEVYIGGKRRKFRNKKQKQGRPGKDSHKTPVFVLVERNGRVRARAVPDVTGATLKGAIREHVTKDSRIMTDEYLSYHGLAKEFASHETVSHKALEYARNDVHVNTAEAFK